MKGNYLFKYVTYFMLAITLTSLIGCNLKDDYIIKTKDSSEEELSGKKVDDIFNKGNMKKFIDKLKSTPNEVSGKLDDIDINTEEKINELTNKVEELTGKLDDMNLEDKSQEINNKIQEVSESIDKLKGEIDNKKSEVDKIKGDFKEIDVNDTIGEFEVHLNNLEKALNRIGQ